MTKLIDHYISLATEPNDCVWEKDLTVNSVYVGDYNANLGKVCIYCTNKRLYAIERGSDLANLVYASAMNAITKSKKVDIYRSVTMNGEAYTIYRVNIKN